MPCTLEQLQQTEYDILCKAVDFFDKYSIKYCLHGGTLLGAIRHNGFIPWDDDVDIILSYNEFNKFLKKFKKHPIDGYNLSWFTTEMQYPIQFAKIRKNGTYMPESGFEGLELDNGVWIDLFVYFGKPNSSIGIKIQEKLLGMFQMTGCKYFNRSQKEKGIDYISSSRLNKLIDKTPDKVIKLFRKFLWRLLSLTDKKHTENVRSYDYYDKHNECIKRNLIEGTTTHIFNDREFAIPKNYDGLLTHLYGEYMTPVKTHTHVDLEKIKL